MGRWEVVLWAWHMQQANTKKPESNNVEGEDWNETQGCSLSPRSHELTNIHTSTHVHEHNIYNHQYHHHNTKWKDKQMNKIGEWVGGKERDRQESKSNQIKCFSKWAIYSGPTYLGYKSKYKIPRKSQRYQVLEDRNNWAGWSGYLSVWWKRWQEGEVRNQQLEETKREETDTEETRHHKPEQVWTTTRKSPA